MFSRHELAAHCRTLGIAEGDTVMLHASVRAVGDVAGGPDEIHLAVRDAVGDAGTLMMYVGSPDGYDDVGRGVMSPEEEEEVLAKLPAYDPLTAKAARDFGALAEFFRCYPGVRVSQHITRFAAAGRNADAILAPHPWDYAFGLDTPLDRFKKLDGKILLLGSDRDTVTFLHYVEHVVDFPNKIIARFKVPVVVDGERVWRDMEEVNTADAGAHANWPDRFFAEIVDGYLKTAGNSGGRIGNAQSFLLSARGLFDFAAPIMKAVASKGAKD